jgi:hypothetical protein
MMILNKYIKKEKTSLINAFHTGGYDNHIKKINIKKN